MRDLGISDDVVNVNGGAIALGHPVGMSGARIVGSIIHELRRRGGGLGAAALCGGGGQGDAALVRAVIAGPAPDLCRATAGVARRKVGDGVPRSVTAAGEVLVVGR